MILHPQAEQWSWIRGDTTPVGAANSVADRVIDQPLVNTGYDHLNGRQSSC
jgi:hypothetical protein